MEKIGINIVGLSASSSDDHSTLLYNVGGGFRSVTGKIVCRDSDSLYLGFTSERAYTVTVEGDLVLTTETSDSFQSKIDGVAGFDIDWSETAKAFGNGSGKIIVTNSDAPSEVSTFEVFMGELRSVVVDFAAGTGNCASFVINESTNLSALDKAFQALLTSSPSDNPYAVGLAFYDAAVPALGHDNAYRVLNDMYVVFGDGRDEHAFGGGKDMHILQLGVRHDSGETAFSAADVYRFCGFDSSVEPLGAVYKLSDLHGLPPVKHTKVFGGVELFAFIGDNIEMDILPRRNADEAFLTRIASGDFDNWPQANQDRFAQAVREEIEAMSNTDGRNGMSNGDNDIIGTPNLGSKSQFNNDEVTLIVGSGPGNLLEERLRGLGLRFEVCSDTWPFAVPGIPAFLVGDYNEGGLDPNYHRPDDVLIIGAHLDSAPRGAEDVSGEHGHITLVRAGIEDLIASYREDGGIEVEVQVRDFDQLVRTRSNDLERIELAVAAANALGIDTSTVASKRDEVLAKLVVFSDRFESGGEQSVTEGEGNLISEVFGELWGIHSNLDTQVSHWHHYKQHEANHDAWEKRLADRKRNFKVADDAADNRIATSYVTYAANPEDTLQASKTAFVELFQAIQKGDLRAAHEADTRARQFSTREHMLDALIRRGKLVVVEESTTA